MWHTFRAAKRKQTQSCCSMLLMLQLRELRVSISSPLTPTFSCFKGLRRFSELCQNTSFVTGRGERHCKILLCPIVQALGPTRTAALPGFHTWNGVDITGSFVCKGKLGCWKAFPEADEDGVTALEIWVQPCNPHQVPLLQLSS